MKDTKYYQSLYKKFIQTRKERKQINGYVENHHILPRCMGGLDIPENYVSLTSKEHYFAHLLLYKAYPKNSGLKRALSAMIYGSHARPHKALNSRSYQRIRNIMTIQVPEKSILEQMYYKQNMSYKKIGTHFNVSDMTVCKWFKQYKIKAKQSKEYHSFEIPKKEDLQNKTPYEIKKMYNVSRSLVYKWLKHYDISPERTIGIKKPRPPAEELKKMYNEQKLSIKKISIHYNVGMPLIREWFKEFNIKKINCMQT